jgi:hypothetical protein
VGLGVFGKFSFSGNFFMIESISKKIYMTLI